MAEAFAGVCSDGSNDPFKSVDLEYLVDFCLNFCLIKPSETPDCSAALVVVVEMVCWLALLGNAAF